MQNTFDLFDYYSYIASLGLVLVNIIQPGKLIDEQSRIDNRISYEIWATFENLEIKDGINYLSKSEFFERAQRISELSRSELVEAS